MRYITFTELGTRDALAEYADDMELEAMEDERHMDIDPDDMIESAWGWEREEW